jgi:zinc/manganese transport system substrate-binding protein
LERSDPTHAAAYRAGLRRFRTSLGPLKHEVAQIKTSFGGKPVAYTEPVPGYLLAAAGLDNLAPDTFTRAIENGTEPTPQAVSAMNALVRSHRVKVLLYNSQAVSPITTQIRSAAGKAGIPVIGVTETLPPNLTFQQWQLTQARELLATLKT